MNTHEYGVHQIVVINSDSLSVKIPNEISFGIFLLFKIHFKYIL